MFGVTQLLVHKNKWKSPALNAFIDFIGMLYENKKYHILPYAPPYCVYDNLGKLCVRLFDIDGVL